jgi:hypothetical protein
MPERIGARAAGGWQGLATSSRPSQLLRSRKSDVQTTVDLARAARVPLHVIAAAREETDEPRR